VIREAKKYVPHAEIFVFDNNSTDQTARVAREAGAHVISSPLQGKGNVVRHAFRVIDADIFLLIDGDDTYPLEEAHKLLTAVIEKNHAMAIGTRITSHQEGSFRRYHVFGNRLFSTFVSLLFHQKVTDMLSGFRAMSREMVDQLRIHSRGFEIETDLTLQAISKGFSIVEIPIAYRARPAGSHSKLNTYRDGYFIMKFIFKLMKDYRPLPFFGFASLMCFILGGIAGYQPIMDYIQFSFVYTVPRAILAASLMTLSFMFFGVGLILDSQIRSFNDQLSVMQRMLRKQENSSFKKTA
jgi:glycosyltransferase involved in cell wall biosynthesis